MFSECQTDFKWCNVEELTREVNCLKAALLERVEFTTKTILEGNDKLTRFYTGLPTYDSFIALVNYLEPKAMELISWNGSKTKGEAEIEGRPGVRCFASLTIADQLFSVLI